LKVLAPAQVPIVVVRDEPTSAVPLSTGLAYTFGATVSETIPVARESFVALPSAFVAVTRTRSVWPTSAFSTV